MILNMILCILVQLISTPCTQYSVFMVASLYHSIFYLVCNLEPSVIKLQSSTSGIKYALLCELLESKITATLA